MLSFPTQFNSVDFLVLKDFLQRPSNFPVKSDDSCFPNVSLLINEEILSLLSPQLLREAIRSRSVRGEGKGRVTVPGCWKTVTARKSHLFGTKGTNRLLIWLTPPGKGSCQLTGKGSPHTTLSSLTKYILAKIGC